MLAVITARDVYATSIAAAQAAYEAVRAPAQTKYDAAVAAAFSAAAQMQENDEKDHNQGAEKA